MKVPLMSDVFAGNTVLQYLHAFAVFAVVLFAFELLRRIVIAKLQSLAEKTDTDIDDFAVGVLDTIRSPEVYLLAFYIATRPLVLTDWAHRTFRDVVILAVTYRALKIAQRFAEYFVGKAVGPRETALTPAELNTQRNITYIVNFVLWILAGVFVLHNLGFRVEGIIAGLGVTGVAVGLGAQALLGDLFAAVAIFLDRPFKVGDHIALDNDWKGTVERIGLKTTRVRSPNGELVVFPNSTLTNNKLRNFSS